MTQTAQHTPTPWQVDPNPALNGRYVVIRPVDSDGSYKEHIATLIANDPNDGSGMRSVEENAANAAYMVKAVNCHNNLLEVLENIANEKYMATGEQMAAVKAAIAAAKGK